MGRMRTSAAELGTDAIENELTLRKLLEPMQMQCTCSGIGFEIPLLVVSCAPLSATVRVSDLETALAVCR